MRRSRERCPARYRVSQARLRWRTGRSVGGPRGPLPGRREARLYGPDGRASVIPRPDQGARAPVRFGRTARYWQNTAVERRLACALRHWARTPRQACLLPGCADRRSAPSFLWRDGENDTKVRPGIAATGWRSVGFKVIRHGEVRAAQPRASNHVGNRSRVYPKIGINKCTSRHRRLVVAVALRGPRSAPASG